jgi:hypothetical protein
MTVRKVCVRVALAAILGLLATSPAQAAIVTNVSYPASFEFSFPNGDHVVIAGNLHLLTAVTLDKQGGFHLVQESNPQGMSGVSDLGVRYRATGVKRYENNVKDATYPYQFTAVWRVDLHGDGPSNDAILHITAHTTINANGETTVEFETWRITFGADGPW